MRNNIISYDVEYERNANSDNFLSRNIAFVNQKTGRARTIRFDCLYEDGWAANILSVNHFVSIII